MPKPVCTNKDNETIRSLIMLPSSNCIAAHTKQSLLPLKMFFSQWQHCASLLLVILHKPWKKHLQWVYPHICMHILLSINTKHIQHLNQIDFADTDIVIQQPIESPVVSVSVCRAHWRTRLEDALKQAVLADTTKREETSLICRQLLPTWFFLSNGLAFNRSFGFTVGRKVAGERPRSLNGSSVRY